MADDFVVSTVGGNKTLAAADETVRLVMRHRPQVAGADVSTANPMPVALPAALIDALLSAVKVTLAGNLNGADDSVSITSIGQADNVIGRVRLSDVLGVLSSQNTTGSVGASGTFTGVGESGLLYAAVGIYQKHDRNGTLNFQISPDDVNYTTLYTCPTVANQPTERTFSVSPFDFWRVQWINGTASTALGWVRTIKRPFGLPLPAALTASGNLKVAVVEGGAGGGAGTEYAEGAVAATATGPALMFKVSQTGDIIAVVCEETPLPVQQGRLRRENDEAAVVSPVLTWASSNGNPVASVAAGNLGGAALVAAPAAANHLRVHRLVATNWGGAAVRLHWRDGATGVLLHTMSLDANGGMAAHDLRGSWRLTGGATPLGLFAHTDATGGSIDWVAGYESRAD